MIDLADLSESRPYLYHLTEQLNVKNIVESGYLFCSREIVRAAGLSDGEKYLTERRPVHVRIPWKDGHIHIRDQRPISEKALRKCLTDGLTPIDYFFLLNSKVFFWPTIQRLERHFRRYAHEGPVVLRFRTLDLINLNPYVEFSRINSGATRPSTWLGGIAPLRGSETFQKRSACPFRISEIAEVTFPDKCCLPRIYWKSFSVCGPWRTI